MSDFSLFSLFTAGLACLSVVSAYTQPKGDSPSGNPISQPGLNSVVPAGESFTVTWNPTTPDDTVTLVLLKGPSSNAVPQYPIVEKIPNSGSYVWKVASDLAPSDPSTPAQGYGIQLIDDKTGAYQYTTQFGISNPNYKAQSSSSSSASEAQSYKTSSAPSYGGSKTSEAQSYQTTSAPAVHVTDIVTKYTTYCPEATTFTHGNKTYSVSKATTLTLDVTTSAQQKAPVGTGSIVKPHNVTMVAPTGYAPSTILTSASAASYSAPSKPTEAATTAKPYTGGASTLATSFAGLVLAAGAAVLAL